MSKVQFTVQFETKHFVAGLKAIKGIVSRKTNFPVLSQVAIGIDHGGSGRLLATDLEYTIEWGSNETRFLSAVLVSAHDLYAVVKDIKDPYVRVEATEAGRLVVDGSELVTTDFEEFPVAPFEFETHRVSFGENLLQAIDYVLPSVSKDAGRYNLNGVYFEEIKGSNKINLVATDGHRLSLVKEIVGLGGFILPGKFLERLRASKVAFDHVQVSTKNEAVQFTNSDRSIRFTSKRIEVEFPNYEQVLPKKSDTYLSNVKADELSKAIKKVLAVVENPHRSASEFTFVDHALEVSGSSHEKGTARHRFNGFEVTGKLPPKFGINASYVRDFLGTLAKNEKEVGIALVLSEERFGSYDDKARWVPKKDEELTEEEKARKYSVTGPIIFRSQGNESRLTLIMPMRLD